jgi:hypothetical protein
MLKSESSFESKQKKNLQTDDFLINSNNNNNNNNKIQQYQKENE